MAIANRELDVSQQKDVIYWNGTTQISTGATQIIALMAYPGTIQSMRSFALGVSGAMQVGLEIWRFVAGQTVIAAGISNMILSNFGTSGVLGYSGLAAAGSTLLNFGAGDALAFRTSVANSAALQVALEVVVKKTQDIVQYNGVSS